jgi:hypothetical protein
MNAVRSNSANRKRSEDFAPCRAFLIVALTLTINSCSPSKTPTKQQSKEFVEGNLRRIGTPIKNFAIGDSRLVERPGTTFYCFDWYGDFVWDYPKGTKKKVHGYVKFMKTNEGWKVDHMNYAESAPSSNAELKCD